MKYRSLWHVIVIVTSMLPKLSLSQQVSYYPTNELSFGLHYSQLAEENISPILFRGPGAEISYQKRFDRDNYYQLVKIGATAVFPKSTFENSMSSGAFKGNLKYSLLAKKQLGETVLSYGGFAEISAIDAFYKNFDESRFYWSNFCGIGASVALLYPISDRYALEGSATVPLLGLLFRPQRDRLYKIENTSFGNIIKSNFSNSIFGSIDRNTTAQFKLALLTPLSFVSSISYSYEFIREKVPNSNAYRESSHAVSIGIRI